MTSPISTLTLRSSQAPNPVLAYAYKDRLLVGAGGGILALFDGNHPSSWPSNAAPVNGTHFIDLAGNGDAVWALGAGEVVSYSGNGFDFSAITAADDYYAIPAAAAAAVWGTGSGATATANSSGVPTITAGGTLYKTGEAQAVFSGGGLANPMTVACTVVAGVVTAIPTPSFAFTSAPTIFIVPSPQEFLACTYVKLPTSGDWNPAVTLTPFVNWSENANMFATPDMGSFGGLTTAGVKQLQAYRPFSVTAREFVTINPASTDFGTFAQVAMWRQAGQLKMRLKTKGQTALGQAAVVASIASPNPSTNSFAAKTGRVGFTSPNGPFSGIGTSYRVKHYRSFVSNLRVDARDPIATLDADWTRATARPYA